MIEPPEEATGPGTNPGAGADFGTSPAAVDAEALERKFQRELNAGLVALVLLAVLEHAGGELYGYQIAKQLQQDGGRVALIKQGALYPVLRTLSANGLLASRVEPSLAGPPAPLLPDNARRPRSARALERHLARHPRLRRPLHPGPSGRH